VGPWALKTHPDPENKENISSSITQRLVHNTTGSHPKSYTVRISSMSLALTTNAVYGKLYIVLYRQSLSAVNWPSFLNRNNTTM
jgi:hypothetical protein